METVWQFKTKRFTIALEFEDPWDLDLSWDDAGEVAEGLDSGRLIAFDAKVAVYLDGFEVGSDHLGNCVYLSADEFATSHRDRDPMNRNCSVMREACGQVSICHYFPDMVREAIAEARKLLKDVPDLREVN